MTNDNEKEIYVMISLYDLRRLAKVPSLIFDIVKYLKQIRPDKYDYSVFEELDEFFRKFDDYLK